MDHSRIAELLEPFLTNPLSSAQLTRISTYIDILIRWNSRINLTAIRNPEEIVTRHFGESLFCAEKLCAQHLRAEELAARTAIPHVVDIGSGAGFPGLPFKIFSPDISLTLIESNHKKVAFLREVIRSLSLEDATAFAGRVEAFTSSSPISVVTLRAVEHFTGILPIAVRLAAPSGSLALLIGQDQVKSAHELAPDIQWDEPAPIPLSQNRVMLAGAAERN
jgi:16S rRNA (guanine527-N7)-methyltransferase